MTPTRGFAPSRLCRAAAAVLSCLLGLFALAVFVASHAAAVDAPTPGPTAPAKPKLPGAPTAGGGTVTVDIDGLTGGKPSSSLTVIVAITLLSVAPALLLMTTSFTKIVVVLSLTRNALGLQGIPPNQVLVGLAMFLSLFVMGPVLSAVNDAGVQPYLDGSKSQSQAFDDGVAPLREFMLDQTRQDELAMLSKVAEKELPETREDVPLTTLIPAFVLSELKSAFIIGFVIFIPFLIIDLVVSAALMSMGMMMLPPVMISLPFKILLFVLVDGWGLIVTALVQSYG
ncbi:MAG: flagellar type III secretion system pore protein FliP [Sporichthyaceae bacterium]